MSLESPQLEDGHLKIVNSIAEALAHTQLSGYESRVLWFLWRKTYGWSKKADPISLSQWVDGTWLDKKSVMRTLKRLRDRRLIVRHGDEIVTSETRTYEFNKHFGEWKVVTKSSPVTKSSLEVVTKSPPTTTIEDTTSKRSLEDMSCKSSKVTKKSDRFLVDAYAVLSCLNDKAHHQYQQSPSSVIEILKRLKAGATVSDLELIIDYKVYEWASTPLAKNLNNETLFRDCHYANYLEAARAWDIKRQTGANSLMMEPVETTPMTDEERKKAKADLFAGFGDGPDGDDLIQLEAGK